MGRLFDIESGYDSSLAAPIGLSWLEVADKPAYKQNTSNINKYN